MKAMTLFLVGIAICVLSLSRYREVLISGPTLSVSRFDAWGLSCERELAIKVDDVRDITVTNYYAGIADGGLEEVSDLCILLGDGRNYRFPSELFSTSHPDRATERQNALRDGMKQGAYRRIAFAAWPFAIMGAIFSVLGLLGMLLFRKPQSYGNK